jgi:hypothetical protein
MIRTLNPGVTRIKLKNNIVVYENFIKCTIKDYEFNLSYNPTLLSGSQGILSPYSASIGGDIVYINNETNYGILKDFTTGSISGSEFSPYVTTIGLYNDAGDLLAVAKMSSPIPISSNTDMTFLIKYDTQWIPKPYFTVPASVSITPSITPSNTVSPSLTPSVTKTPSSTPSVTVSPSTPASPSNTPSTTPSATPSKTPSITPTPSKSPSATTATLTFNQYQGNTGPGFGVYTFNLDTPLSSPLVISSAPISAFANPVIACDETEQLIGPENLASSITWSSGQSGVKIGNGNNIYRFQCGTVVDYRLNYIIVNGVPKYDGQTIVIGTTTITISLGSCKTWSCI